MVRPASGQLAHEDDDDRPRVSPLFAQSARSVHGEPDIHRVVEWILGAARAVTGADHVGLSLIAAGATSSWQTLDRPIRPLTVVDPRDQAVLVPAARSGETVHIGDGLGVPAPFKSLLACPVLNAEQIIVGVLVAAHRNPDQFDADAQEGLSALGAHLGVALDNQATVGRLSELEEAQRDLVHQLQVAVRPGVIQVPNTELGAHYSAAEQGAPTGGDLWDWVLLPTGELHVAVIDIMGKGVKATKDALAVAHALRLLVLDGCPMEHVVARADRIVTQQNPDLVATLILTRYDPATGVLRLAGAGHPPALLVGGPDEIRQLPAPGIPIGWPGAGSETVVEVELERSQSVILYTDGLIESTKDILAGLAALERAACDTFGFPASQQARILVERALDGADRRDDSLAVVLRRRNPAADAPRHTLGPFGHRLSRSLAGIGLARDLLRDWLERLPAEPEAVADLLLVASELSSNAVRHASWEREGAVLRAFAEGPDVIIEVEDDGEGLTLPYLDDEPPDREAEQGRGLWLVHTLTDELEQVGSPEGGNVLRCFKRSVIARPD
ncbi:MAG TPA: SpoIIE family protein phosphatase [Acidimicrobiales bacterium]|nr:SpoIIE family protein phosphatase [Acidimicrobiales bacterium]